MSAEIDDELLAKYQRTRKKTARQNQIYFILAILLSVVLLPSAIVFFFGMLPTLVVAFFIDRRRRKSLTVTVGAMNLAGTTPFLIRLWDHGHKPDEAFAIMAQPFTIVSIYMAASVGYMINWAVTGLVTSLKAEGGKGRVKSIEKQKKELERRWGREVTGKLQLDSYGFPVKTEEGE